MHIHIDIYAYMYIQSYTYTLRYIDIYIYMHIKISGEARTNSSVMYSPWTPHMAKQKQDNKLEFTYSSYVSIRDIAQKTCQKR